MKLGVKYVEGGILLTIYGNLADREFLIKYKKAIEKLAGLVVIEHADT